jgi:hypothetical protein
MSAKWKPQPKQVLLHWISSLDDPVVKETLTDWEAHFVASLSFQVARHGTCSEKQQDILERIYAEKSK